MSNEAVSPLRRRMIDDMTIRHFGAKTQADYIRTVRTFAAFLGQSPDQAEPEDLRRFRLHMAAQGASPAKMNAAVSALRFFFHVTLGRSASATGSPPSRRPSGCPWGSAPRRWRGSSAARRA